MSRILLVDDDEDMAMMCGMWLKKAGYEVRTAYSGSEAIEALLSEGADAVLLDYMMPGMNGAETLRRIRESDSIKDVPVFFRTGAEDGEIEGELSGLSPEGIIPKSAGKKALIESLSALFG